MFEINKRNRFLVDCIWILTYIGFGSIVLLLSSYMEVIQYQWYFLSVLVIAGICLVLKVLRNRYLHIRVFSGDLIIREYSFLSSLKDTPLKYLEVPISEVTSVNAADRKQGQLLEVQLKGKISRVAFSSRDMTFKEKKTLESFFKNKF